MAEPLNRSKLTHEKHFLQVSTKDTICIHRFYYKLGGTPIFMLHGAIENGKIFYSTNQKGLGPFLARQGYDVFIADMRGKGDSYPTVDKHLTYTQKDLIAHDIPMCLDFIISMTEKKDIHLVSHSWGGVWLYGFLARAGEKYNILSQVMFGAKRRVSVISLKRFLLVEVVWNWGGRFLNLIFGYAKFKKGIAGVEHEPRNLFREMNAWAYQKKWICTTDGFNYAKALQKKIQPPTLHLTGIKDDVLGNPIDVEVLINESGKHKDLEFHIMGKNYGNLRDYSHNDILIHPLAEEDTYLTALNWINKFDE